MASTLLAVGLAQGGKLKLDGAGKGGKGEVKTFLAWTEGGLGAGGSDGGRGGTGV